MQASLVNPFFRSSRTSSPISSRTSSPANSLTKRDLLPNPEGDLLPSITIPRQQPTAILDRSISILDQPQAQPLRRSQGFLKLDSLVEGSLLIGVQRMRVNLEDPSDERTKRPRST